MMAVEADWMDRKIMNNVVPSLLICFFRNSSDFGCSDDATAARPAAHFHWKSATTKLKRDDGLIDFLNHEKKNGAFIRIYFWFNVHIDSCPIMILLLALCISKNEINVNRIRAALTC